MVIPDNAQKRALYEEQVIRTFFISHADATELAQIAEQRHPHPGARRAPLIVAEQDDQHDHRPRHAPTSSRSSSGSIEPNDNPRAEVVIDVQILEVNRTRAKQFGLDLSQLRDQRRLLAGSGSARHGDGDAATLDAAAVQPEHDHARHLDRRLLPVGAVGRRPLPRDRHRRRRLIAKPQLRGAEGQKITLNLGDEIPVPSTVFTPIAQGGANFNPLTSFNYRPVGVNVEMTPRVTFEGDIILDLLVENSTLGQDVNDRRPEPAVVRRREASTRGCGCATASRTCWPGCCARTSGKSLRGIPGPAAPADPPQPVRRRTTPRSARPTSSCC